MNDNPIFAIADRAKELRQLGVEVVTLAAGEPEEATDALIVEAAAAALSAPETHHYGPAQGDPELRDLVAAQLTERTGVSWSSEDVLITIGAKHALYLAIHATVTPGDEVLVVSPGWPGHDAAVSAAGAVPVAVASDARFRVTIEALEQQRTARTRALILASPANPTGAILEADLLRDVLEWAARRDITVVSDDIYSAFDYAGVYRSVFSVMPDPAADIIVVGGVSKEFAMTGWRVGWLAGQADTVATARRHLAQTISHVPMITQRAAVAALQHPEIPEASREVYRKRRDRLVAALQPVDGLEIEAPNGGMFAFVDVRGILELRGLTSSAQLAEQLLEEAHVAVVPGEAFHAPGWLRLCFAVGDESLDLAISRLESALDPSTQTSPE